TPWSDYLGRQLGQWAADTVLSISPRSQFPWSRGPRQGDVARAPPAVPQLPCGLCSWADGWDSGRPKPSQQPAQGLRPQGVAAPPGGWWWRNPKHGFQV
ncbi:MAG: hypothetical protein ACRDBM_10740, partial [Sporomusa sp.]